jgi:hypothetical protein
MALFIAGVYKTQTVCPMLERAVLRVAQSISPGAKTPSSILIAGGHMAVRRLVAVLVLTLLIAKGSVAAPQRQVPQPQELSYADLADMALAAPVVAGAEIRGASRIKGEAAAGVPAGRARFLIRADVKALIRGEGGLPAKVTYLVDVPLGPANRSPLLRKARVLLLAARVPNRPAELRLIARDAQLRWTPEMETRVRAILTAANAPDAPPRITGVGRAFHVPGSLPGESETQIFLTTSDNRPISLAVLRRPEEKPKWVVSLGEIVDDSAAPPTRDTLLWYRLACALPATLPDASIADLNPEEAAAAADDYRLVLGGLGPCTRNLSSQS